jgi:hypothetical protein
MPIRQFNLKDGTLVPHPDADDRANPGRTIYPEPMRMAEPNWTQRNYASGESVQRREDDVTDDELRAAREWLAHVEAGRIGGRR